MERVAKVDTTFLLVVNDVSACFYFRLLNPEEIKQK